MGKNDSSSKTEHVPGPAIISSFTGYDGYDKTTIEKDGEKYTGCGRTSEESQKAASNKANK